MMQFFFLFWYHVLAIVNHHLFFTKIIITRVAFSSLKLQIAVEKKTLRA